jgi:A/G-specific adenine glycosylase
MLQQTQVATVLLYYHEWLRRFPDFAALAAASENDVLHAWQGLGYYARARNLHLTAKIVHSRQGGAFPRDFDSIRNLPGVGRYTANALLTFAFDRSAPIVEANIARLLARLFDVALPIDSNPGREILWNHAAALVPKRDGGRFNSALMDLGALICRARPPKCAFCPVKPFCHTKNPRELPRKKARPRIKELTENHALVVAKKKILLERATERWRGMWILPPATERSTSSRALHSSIFPFTNHRVRLHIFDQSSRRKNKPAQRWFPFSTLQFIPIPSPHRRAIAELLQVGR